MFELAVVSVFFTLVWVGGVCLMAVTTYDWVTRKLFP